MFEEADIRLSVTQEIARKIQLLRIYLGRQHTIFRHVYRFPDQHLREFSLFSSTVLRSIVVSRR